MDSNELTQKLNSIEARLERQEETINRIYKIQKVAIYSRYAYWGFIILATFGAFYFLKPVLGTLGNIYGGDGDVLNILDTVPDINNLKSLKNQLQ